MPALRQRVEQRVDRLGPRRIALDAARRRRAARATVRAPSGSRCRRTNRSPRAPRRRARSTTCRAASAGARCGSRASDAENRARSTRRAHVTVSLLMASTTMRHQAARSVSVSEMTRPSLSRMMRCVRARERVIVRHENDRRLRLAVERLEQIDDVRAGVAVEISRRLVGEQDSRRVGERARDRDALLFAAGELRGEMIEPIAQARRGASRSRARSPARRRRRAARAAPARSRSP